MIIWSSIKVSSYYCQFKAVVLLNIFCGNNKICFLESSKENHLFETQSFVTL